MSGCTGQLSLTIWLKPVHQKPVAQTKRKFDQMLKIKVNTTNGYILTN